MRVSASRLATLLAARLCAVVPPSFDVRAVGSAVVVHDPDGWNLTMDIGWIEEEDDDRTDIELAELVVGNALNHLQDAVSEAEKVPWPPLAPGSMKMAPYGTRADDTSIHLWFGRSERSPVIAFEPIPLREIARQE